MSKREHWYERGLCQIVKDFVSVKTSPSLLSTDKRSVGLWFGYTGWQGTQEQLIQFRFVFLYHGSVRVRKSRLEAVPHCSRWQELGVGKQRYSR